MIRFYDSNSALVGAQLENRANVVLVRDISLGARFAELSQLKALYRCDPPFVFLYVKTDANEENDIAIWAMRDTPETALFHVASRLPESDTIAAVALFLNAKAIYLQSTHSRVSLMHKYLCLLFGKRSDIGFDLPWLLRRGNPDCRTNVPVVFVRNESTQRNFRTVRNLFLKGNDDSR